MILARITRALRQRNRVAVAREIVNAPRAGATWEEPVSSGDTGLLPRAALRADPQLAAEPRSQ